MYQQIYPPASYSVDGSASLFDHYRDDIGKISPDSLMYTLNPKHNHRFAGNASHSRLKVWNRVSEAKSKQRSQIQSAGASMMHGMASGGSICPPQSAFDKLKTATDVRANRTIARDLSKLITLTLEEQDEVQNEEKGQNEDVSSGGRGSG